MPNRNRPAIARRCTVAAALTATAIAATSVSGTANAAEQLAVTAPTSSNVVVEWNRTLLSLVVMPGAQPATIQPTRDFAIMSAAVFDAVHETSVRHPAADRASIRAQKAAAAQAAHDVLTATFPSFTASLDQQLTADLASIPALARSEGVQAGARAAATVLRARAGDGAAANPPVYQTTGLPGDYRPTPPAFATPVFTHWAAVTPFLLRRADQFRPPPPPPFSSAAYAAALNEVKSLGQNTSATRTAKQTTIANFWSGPIQNYWNAIADEVILAHGNGTAGSARTLALLDAGLADATIALYDAKYTYRLWRPITAIRAADTDRNRLTIADPDWTPLSTTPADPSYPGAHSTISAAAATILSACYGDRTSFTVTSPVLSGVTRSFETFHDAAVEAGLSRIYAGVHTRIDHQAGLVLGDRVGANTIEHLLVHHHR